jgi:hypothetical protein
MKVSSDWEKKWNDIIERDFLNLPKQDIVDKRFKTQINERLVIGDGVTYTIEVLLKNNKRKFTYDNPIAFYDFYKEKGFLVQEYVDFISFIEILDKEFDKK